MRGREASVAGKRSGEGTRGSIVACSMRVDDELLITRIRVSQVMR